MRDDCDRKGGEGKFSLSRVARSSAWGANDDPPHRQRKNFCVDVNCGGQRRSRVRARNALAWPSRDLPLAHWDGGAEATCHERYLGDGGWPPLPTR